MNKRFVPRLPHAQTRAAQSPFLPDLLRGPVFAILLTVFLLLSSCFSAPKLDQEAPSLYFKAAESARFQRKWRDAIQLYKLTQLRFADQFPIILEAEFSIAQIYFSWKGHDEQAKEHYQNVIAFYERPEFGSDVFPTSYLELARGNLLALEERRGFSILPPKTEGVRSVPRNRARINSSGASKASEARSDAQE